MTPFIKQSDHILCDLALCQQHLEHLVSEYLLQSFGVNGRRDGKHAVFMKATVGNKDMQVRMKSQWGIPERLYGYNRTGYSR